MLGPGNNGGLQDSKVCSPTSCRSGEGDPFGAQHDNFDRGAVKKLVIAIVLCFIFMIAELVGGYLSSSLAIMTDAAHLLSDVAGFLISLCAIGWSRKRASAYMSYGYHRAEILGALISISMVWALTFWLVVEAINRLRNPMPIDGQMMFIVALLGVAVNGVIGWVLHDHSHPQSHGHSHELQEHHHQVSSNYAFLNGEEAGDQLERQPIPTGSHSNLNVRAAFIHAIGDLIQSVGVLLAAIIVWYKPEWKIADPLCTFLFSILVVASTWMLARDTVIILMEGTPKGISSQAIQQQLAAIDGVREVHDLHVWSLAPGKASATVHIVIDWSRLMAGGGSEGGDPSLYERVLSQCQSIICRHGIHHVTIQVDPDRRMSVHCRVDCCGSVDNFISNTPPHNS